MTIRHHHARRYRALLAGALALCMALPAAAADTAPTTELPDLSAIRAQIYSGEYPTAIEGLLALTETVQHADLYNLLGFSYRSLGQYDEAARWYKEALYFDAGHRAALEYQGELFIATGDIEAARKNLNYLRLLCGEAGCAEHEKLRKALAEAGHAPAPGS